MIGGLNFLARSTRWDIAHATSRVSADMHNPTVGTRDALEHMAGYLLGNPGLGLAGKRGSGSDQDVVHVDADHHGDPAISAYSHTGVTVFLNGTPIFWRSNKQKFAVAMSPAEAEIYAMPEGVRDARDIAWVLEEMGCKMMWPLNIYTDSDAAISFQWDSVPKSKIRGCIDKRLQWVEDLRNRDEFTSVYVRSLGNMADIHTKCLATKEYVRQRDNIVKCQDVRRVPVLG